MLIIFIFIAIGIVFQWLSSLWLRILCDKKAINRKLLRFLWLFSGICVAVCVCGVISGIFALSGRSTLWPVHLAVISIGAFNTWKLSGNKIRASYGEKQHKLVVSKGGKVDEGYRRSIKRGKGKS
jgi:hypothetical protein